MGIRVQEKGLGHMALDFTLDKYRELCSALLVNHYVTLTFSEYLENGNKLSNNFVIIRHDIDRKPLNALRMAKLENKLGIRSTYYFRYPYTFYPNLIKEIADLGHEVGYHYEVLSKSKGDFKRAIELFEDELNKFRAISDIKTICMHGSPMSKYDNRDIWKHYNLMDFGLEGEAYLSIAKDVNYFSDTGRSWNCSNKIRDFIPDKNEDITMNYTEDLIRLARIGNINKLYILVHPERWSSNNADWICVYLKDYAFNFGKKLLRTFRDGRD